MAEWGDVKTDGRLSDNRLEIAGTVHLRSVE